MIHCRSITEPKKIERESRKMALTDVKFTGALTYRKRFFKLKHTEIDMSIL